MNITNKYPSASIVGRCLDQLLISVWIILLQYLESCVVVNEMTGSVVFEDLSQCRHSAREGQHCDKDNTSGSVVLDGIRYRLYSCVD